MCIPKVGSWLGLSFLFFSGAALAALPPSDPADAMKEIERVEEQNQPWEMPDHSGESVAAFFARLRRQAQAGDIKAAATLGYHYQHGGGVKQDYEQARSWYEKAAAGGHAEAKAALAMLCERGLGGPADQPRALQLYTEAATEGSAWAQYSLGLHYAHGNQVRQNWSEAARWYGKAVAQKQPQACINLACIHLYGYGLPVNAPEAERLFRLAAEAGSPVGQFDLGLTLARKGNKAEAANWYRKAAIAGYPQGETAWTKCLLHGEGVPADWNAALKWAQKAGREGNINAGLQAAAIVLGHRDLDEAAKREAIEWAREAAAQKSPSGCYYLGCALQSGVGVEKDVEAGLAKLREAAALGSADAECWLGTVTETGNGVPRDFHEAARWYRLAAEAGCPPAQYRYGVFLRDGTGVDVNVAQAVLWLERAVQADPAKPGWKSDLELARRLRAREPMIEADAELRTGVSLRHLALTGKPELMAESVQHLEKAADAGLPIAKALLAWNYRRAQGVPRDGVKAETLISELEETNDAEVLFRMALSYFLDDRLIDPDYVWKAYGYFRRAAERGHARGQNSFGYLLMSSPMIPHDYVESCKWLTLAAKAGEKNAIINLERLKLMLTQKDIEEGERRAAAFQPAKGLPPGS